MTFEAGPVSTSIAAPSFGLHTGISVDDAAALLPDAAASRLMALHQRAADQHAAMPPFEQIRELAEIKMRHTARIKQLLAPKSEGGFGLTELATQVVAERRALERVENELTRQQRLKQDRGDRWQVTAQLKRSVIEWVTAGGIPHGCVVESVADDDVTTLLKKGERIADGVERYRHRLRELAADAHRVRSAPFPSADVKAQLRQQIAQLAEAGRPNVDGAIEHGQQVSFPMITMQSLVRNVDAPAIGFSETIDALALIAWLHRDALIARIEAEVDEIADDKAALSDAEREKQLVAISIQALGVERMEVALIWHAEAKGEVIDFRANTTPQAVLGVRLITAPHREPNYGGHSWPISFGQRP
jgi:hypothetical protein